MTIPTAATTLEQATQVGQTFFVAPSGDDDNVGSFECPFATVEHALEAARDNERCGNQIFLRAGTYAPTMTLLLLEHGGPQCWSRLAAWKNEHVVLDGSNLQKGQSLILIEGSYYEISGLEFVGAPNSGISVYGPHVRLIRNVIRDSLLGAVWSEPHRAASMVFAQNIVYHNCLMNKPRRLAGGWPSAVNLTDHGDVVVDNRIFENYGEGLGVYGADHHVAHNDLHDNFAVEIYLNNATDTTVQANLIHSDGNEEFFRDWNLKADWTKPQAFWAPAQGIAMANESATGIQFARNRVINNIVTGRRYRGLNWWNGFRQPGEPRNGGMVDSLIAHNTVVGKAEALFHLDDNDHTGTEIRNNILYQRNADRPLTEFYGIHGIDFSHNLRYGGKGIGPAGDGKGPGDVERNPRVTDPEGGKPAHYRLRPESPAINAGTPVGVALDYFGNARPYGDRFDIGAHEWSNDS